LLDLERSDAGPDHPLGDVAVADDLAASVPVPQVGMSVDPGGDLGLDGLGHQPCPTLEEVYQYVPALRQWHEADVVCRLIDGGVLLDLVGHLVSL